jgi:hypothetical protein
MQLSELVGQYQNANARPEMTGTKSTRKVVSTLRDMKSGSIFEGTVNSIKGQKVTLGLANGQEVSARMDGKVSLNVGQSMFFQVKSNDGTQIAIRPYTVEGNSANITLIEALKTAGIIVDERNLSMVNAMMEEQMSIDRDSLLQMARIAANNPEYDVKSLVQMQKMELPVTPEMASQYQNYQTDKQAITQALSDFTDELPKELANGELSAEQLTQTTVEVLDILTEGLPEEVNLPEALKAAAQSMEGDTEGAVFTEAGIPETEEAAAAGSDGTQTQAAVVSADGTQAQTEAASVDGAQAQTAAASADGTQAQSAAVSADGTQVQAAVDAAASVPEAGNPYGETANLPTAGAGTANPAPVIDEAFLRAELGEQLSFPAHTVGSLLDADARQTLSEELSNFPELLRNQNLFSNGQLLPTAGTTALLNAIRQQLVPGLADKDSLLALMSGKEFQSLLKDAMEQQWMMKPDEVMQKGKLNGLYEKVEDQLNRLENVMRATGQQSETISNLASDIRNNVQFMDQINQIYTYAQIPLKMSGQQASGELYVYTNKKSLAEGKDELSAFLHLDMEHLGSTDVSVKLHGRHVSTSFYFENDETYALVQAHASILEERLAAKGYNCDVKVINESKKVNFVDDFLKKDQPSTGLVHRYSFDMKA